MGFLEALVGRFASRRPAAPVDGSSSPAAEFRALAREASANGARDVVEALLPRPAQAGWTEEDFELELEMLHGRLAVLDLETILQAGSLPMVTTQHKVVAHEACHFLAPVSVAGDSGTSSAKLFVTSRRLRVLGGHDASLTWGGVRDVVVEERDLVVSSTGGLRHRFRCNSFADAWVAARLAREFLDRHRASLAAGPDPSTRAGGDAARSPAQRPG